MIATARLGYPAAVLTRSLPLLFVVGCAPAPVVPTQAPAPHDTASTSTANVPPRVVVVVRHAEKVSEERDAALSPVGHARAACLAKVLADLGVTHAFHTEFQRTRDTVGPMAAAASVVPEVIPADAKDAWVGKLRGLPPGSIAVVAGHSNSIPGLVAALGAGEVTVEHDAYDWMFVIALPDADPPTLLKTHYCPV